MDPLRLLSFDGHVVTRRRVLQLARSLACLIKEEIPPRNLKLLLDPAKRRIFFSFSFSFSLPIPIPLPPPRMRGRIVGVAAMPHTIIQWAARAVEERIVFRRRRRSDNELKNYARRRRVSGVAAKQQHGGVACGRSWAKGSESSSFGKKIHLSHNSAKFTSALELFPNLDLNFFVAQVSRLLPHVEL